MAASRAVTEACSHPAVEEPGPAHPARRAFHREVSLDAGLPVGAQEEPGPGVGVDAGGGGAGGGMGLTAGGAVAGTVGTAVEVGVGVAVGVGVGVALGSRTAGEGGVGGSALGVDGGTISALSAAARGAGRSTWAEAGNPRVNAAAAKTAAMSFRMPPMLGEAPPPPMTISLMAG
jgi:hypothetical protein